MNIEIEYCVPCGYLDRAVDAQRRLLTEFGNKLASVSLKPGDQGVFTFRAGGREIYSKPAEFNIEDIVATVRQELRGSKAA